MSIAAGLDPPDDPDPPPDPLSEVSRRLSAVLDTATAVPLSCQSPSAVSAFAESLVRARSRLDALLGAAVIAVGSSAEATGDSGLGRPRKAAAAVAANCGADPKPLAFQSRLTQWVDGFAEFRHAHTAGQLSTEHVRVLRTLDNPRTHTALTDAQHYLIAAARRCTWSEFIRVARYWAIAADPDGPEPRDHIQDRYCRLRKGPDGTVTGQFRLDPITGDAVFNAIEETAQQLFRNDTDATSQTDTVSGNGTCTGNGTAAGSGDGAVQRTATQRRADALAALITGKRRAPAILVHLVLSQRVAEQLAAGETVDVDPDDPDRRCELIDGTPIHPRHAAQILAIGAIRRLVLGAKSEVTDLGQAVRTFPAHLKRALLAAARGRCQVRGCDAPIPWLQADHIQPWHRDGPTSLTNGQILCDPHNKAKGAHPPRPPDAPKGPDERDGGNQP